MLIGFSSRMAFADLARVLDENHKSVGRLMAAESRFSDPGEMQFTINFGVTSKVLMELRG